MSDMSDKDRLKEGALLLSRLGAYWRNDWSDFDGRTLRDQLDVIADFLEGGPLPAMSYLEDDDV